MAKKWIIFITILMLGCVLVSGCTDSQSKETVEASAGETTGEQATESTAKEFAIRMEYYGFVPSEMEIGQGDIIVWRNQNKQKVYTLVSDDDLFEEQEMKFGNMFNHAFDEKGTYIFSIKDVPDMTLTITVT
ncbi:hypothetical protein V7O62_08210 [Methanolobus sp. ZRKC2]|uniref:hypothetical protein n=1 Tax=Methanolobus sp. ZRKC2 TaxID=3125783 RepID=UPI003246C7B8